MPKQRKNKKKIAAKPASINPFIPKQWQIDAKDADLYFICDFLAKQPPTEAFSWGSIKKTKNTKGLYFTFPHQALNALKLHLTMPDTNGFPHWTIVVFDNILKTYIYRKIQIDIQWDSAIKRWALKFPRLIYDTARWHFNYLAWNTKGKDYDDAISVLKSNMTLIQEELNLALSDLNIAKHSQVESKENDEATKNDSKSSGEKPKLATDDNSKKKR